MEKTRQRLRWRVLSSDRYQDHQDLPARQCSLETLLSKGCNLNRLNQISPALVGARLDGTLGSILSNWVRIGLIWQWMT